MAYPHITDDDVAAFARDGFVVKRGLFDAEEAALLQNGILADKAIHRRAFALADSQGGATEIAVWNAPGNDLFGAVARGERIVGGAEKLLGGEVYHYHSKLTMKRPGGGGTWDWHQDYGYWYKNGCLFPDMLSVAVAVSPSTRENGCLQVLRGSHRMGRLEHGMVGAQTGADMERVEAAMRMLEHVYLELSPGDAVFFHCNTLHSSDPNRSGATRDVLLCCYNKATNDPYKDHHHPRYTPIDRLPDSEVKRRGAVHDGEARDFLNPANDKSIGKATQPAAA
jgi:hypothetical protein